MSPEKQLASHVSFEAFEGAETGDVTSRSACCQVCTVGGQTQCQVDGVSPSNKLGRRTIYTARGHDDHVTNLRKQVWLALAPVQFGQPYELITHGRR